MSNNPTEKMINPIPVVNSPRQFSYENGILVTRVIPGRAEGVLVVGPNSINPYHNVHGGALATLMDTVAGCCACSKGGSCVTSGCTMEFLRPANGSEIKCIATPKKMGKSLSVIQAELLNTDGAVVATGTYTFFMFPSKD